MADSSVCVQCLSKVHCSIVWLRNFLAFIVSSGKPPMNTVRAAKVETRKLKHVDAFVIAYHDRCGGGV